MKGRPSPYRADDELFEWFTLRYRHIYMFVGVLLASAMVVAGYFWAERLPAQGGAAASTPVLGARFSWIEGDVQVKPVGSQWLRADGTMLLRKNDVIRTSRRGAAEITFFDGMVVHLRPDSLITIQETSEDPGTRAARVAWHIASGEATFRSAAQAPPGSSTVVTTPTVSSAVATATRAVIKVAETGSSEIRIFEGGASLRTSKGQALSLGTLQAVKVDALGLAGFPLQLPPVPEIFEPQRFVSGTVDGGLVRLAWQPLPQAASYRLELDRSSRFSFPILERSGLSETALELRGLEPGRYFWRVAAVGEANLEGNFSEPGRVLVAAPGVVVSPPSLIVDQVDLRGTIAQVMGHTEPGVTVTVNGVRAQVRADGGFNEFVTLERRLGAQDIVVQAARSDGGLAEVRRTVVLQ